MQNIAPPVAKRRLTVVAPALNEADGIGEFCRQILAVADSCPQWEWELLIVDDGSDDTTTDVVRQWRQQDSRVCLLALSRNFGQESAIVAGLSHARGDAAVIMDADLQDPPTLIPQMLAQLDTGFEMINGKYIRHGEGWFKTLSAAAYYKILRALSDRPQPTQVNNFRLISRRVIDEFLSMPERERYARGMFVWLGVATTEIIFHRPPRKQGETKYNFLRLLNTALSGITSFSTTPLRWAMYAGFAALMFAFICVFYILISLIYGNAVSGWASLLGAILIFSGTQLVMLGIIGEYVGKILTEVKKRPLYIKREFLANHQPPADVNKTPVQ